MNEIAKTNFYTMEVDTVKNRLYLKIIGFWSDPSLVPNYLADIKKAAQALTIGFTVLTDLTEMKTAPQEVGELHARAQKILVNFGLKKTAEIVPGSVILKMQVKKFGKISEIQKEQFHSAEEAEAWLEVE
jgi:hypothetical protein